jgi:ammonia channel protein AmtB
MKDWKTTITGLVGGLVGIAAAFGVLIPADVAAGIVAIALFLVAYFAADAKKEG